MKGMRQKTLEALTRPIKAEYSLPSLNESDIQLVSEWSHPKHNNLDSQSIIENYDTNRELGRLLSARSAEKVAAEFYRNYGKAVRDISLTQIGENAGSDWKFYDLDVDGCSVDVKNARISSRSENSYSDYCIPRFKKHRTNREVTIAGVCSPKLSACNMLQATEHCEDGRVTLLGETTRERLEELREEFDIAYLRSSAPTFDSFLPPWTFEYPDYVYRERDVALNDVMKYFNIAKSKDAALNRNLALVAIAAGTDLALFLKENSLIHWQRMFLNQLCSRIQKYGPSLPFIFLTVLAHFLDMARSSKSYFKYNPKEYRNFLFPCNTRYFHVYGERVGVNYDETRHPLGIYDPFKTIDALISTLETLWTAKNGYIRKFKFFRLRRLNILQGKTDEMDECWKTLIAYCGGRSDIDLPCGKSPLVLGESGWCHRWRLICPRCGYCCNSCKYGI